MKRLLLTVGFDGTAYHGWQIQPNGITVEEVIKTAVSKLLKTETEIFGASRTDAGVHAKGFCFHLDCEENIPESAFLRGLNSLLPSDIAVVGVKEVPNDFNARYDALGKTYIYRILNTNKKDPFLSRYTWQIEKPLDIEKMNDFCKKIVGEHDFSAFSSSGRTVESTVRTVSECYTEKNGDIVSLHITANGFLYNMVRIITGTAVEASFGKIDIEKIDDIFKLKKRDLAGITAPPQGLILEKVHY